MTQTETTPTSLSSSQTQPGVTFEDPPIVGNERDEVPAQPTRAPNSAEGTQTQQESGVEGWYDPPQAPAAVELEIFLEPPPDYTTGPNNPIKPDQGKPPSGKPKGNGDDGDPGDNGKPGGGGKHGHPGGQPPDGSNLPGRSDAKLGTALTWKPWRPR